MKLEYFIAKRIAQDKNFKSSISAPIIKIAILAIALGILMMIISVATGKGLQNKIRQKVSAFNGHVIISNYNNNQSDVSTEPISTNQNFYPKFKNITGIRNVQAVASKAGIIRTETEFEGIVFKGVDKNYNWNDISEFLISGRVPNLLDNLNQEVIISQYLSNRLQLKLGSSFNTFFMKDEANKIPNSRRFKIVGIYNSGFQEFDATFVIGDIRHIQKINKWDKNKIGNFEVFIDDFSKIKEKGVEIYSLTSSILDSKTIIEKYYYIFDWLNLFDFNIILIIIIMLSVSTINIVVALLVIILERTQMIGILKSLGANNWMIRKIFLINVFKIIFKGLLLGNFLALSLLLIQKYFGIIKLNPQNYYVNQAPVEIDLLNILILNVFILLISILVLIIPSFIITKLSPSKTFSFT